MFVNPLGQFPPRTRTRQLRVVEASRIPPRLRHRLLLPLRRRPHRRLHFPLNRVHPLLRRRPRHKTHRQQHPERKKPSPRNCAVSRPAGDIASGLSTNPTFFRFPQGPAILDSVRLAPAFFNLGCFRSEGLAISPAPHAFTLRQTRRAAYDQPLRADFRRANGDCPLTNDGRFYRKMDYPRRPRDEKPLPPASPSANSP